MFYYNVSSWNRFNEYSLLYNKDLYFSCNRFRSSTVGQSEKDLRTAGRKIFGVSPVILLQKLGVPLPAAVTNAMAHLRTIACDSIGLFRKPGVQSRIQQLQNEIENNPGKSVICCLGSCSSRGI